ncbi:collagenase [Streptomyces longispororuber]|uniref:collagenase n=1 Tax=Streptomyces longispororuber TaxID=68230 RepID=UPI0036F5A8F4
MFPSRTGPRPPRRPLNSPLNRGLLALLAAVALCVTAAPSGQADTPAPAPAERRTADRGAAAADPRDRAERVARAPKPSAWRPPAPDGLADGRVPGPRTPRPAKPPRAAGCTLDDLTRLSPEGLADFLADRAVTADGCLRTLVWTWDRRLAPVMSDAHVQAVSRRAGALAAGHDGRNGSHLLEMFTYLHAVAYHDFSRDEIDLTDPPTVAATRAAVDAFGSAARTFDATRTNAETLREALYAASAPGLRRHQLPLIQRALATMGPDRPDTHKDASWGGAALAALSVNYLGVYPGNQDAAFHAAVTGAPAYRAAFKAFAHHAHLKGTANAWVARDAVSEYGRMGQIDALRAEVVPGLGPLLAVTARAFGDLSAPWAKVAAWLIAYDACAPYQVCRPDIEKRLFPHTYRYGVQGTDGMAVRTALGRDTVDQLSYASRQVEAQFRRVVGSRTPLAGDPNTDLRVILYASRAAYEDFQPLLTGLGTDNGGMYIERGATFYTYQRRVPQDSSLTLEELFRHEYTHYLNGRWAVPGFFGEGPWYEGDRTTAMDEGTAEFLGGATRDDGVKVRKSLIEGVIADTAGGRPRMTVDELLHATYAGDGFRFYDYAGAFFTYLWTEHPARLQEMYRLLRAGDPAGFDAWRDRLGGDAGVQREFDAFLDDQVARVEDLFVPDTRYVPVGELRAATAARIRDSLTATTGLSPRCGAGGSPERPRFTCTGRVTARLTDAADADLVLKDMAGTVDHFVLERATGGDNNLADMNCSFGRVDIWPDGRGGTSDVHCEGPLRG